MKIYETACNNNECSSYVPDNACTQDLLTEHGLNVSMSIPALLNQISAAGAHTAACVVGILH